MSTSHFRPVSLPLVHCCLLCAVSPGSRCLPNFRPVSLPLVTLLPSVQLFHLVVGVYHHFAPSHYHLYIAGETAHRRQQLYKCLLCAVSPGESVSTDTLPRLTHLYIAAFCVLFHLVKSVSTNFTPSHYTLVHCCLLCAVSPGKVGVYHHFTPSHYTCTLLPSVCCFTW